METVGTIQNKMVEVEDALAGMELTWQNAAQARVMLDYDVKRREAAIHSQLKGTGTIPDIKAFVTESLWAEPDEVMIRLVTAEATEEACRARFKALDRRLSSLQSRLQAAIRLDSQPTRPHPGGME